MSQKRPLRLALLLVLGCGLLTGTAAAYIDPGTGSYVLQVAIAFLVAIAFSVKVFWKKIVAFLQRLFARKTSNGGDAS